MIKVAIVTCKRLLLDKTVVIAMWLVPILIVLAFGMLTRGPGQQAPLKLALVGTLPASVVERLPEQVRLISPQTIEEALDLLKRGKVGASILTENGEITGIYAQNQQDGEIVASILASDQPSRPQNTETPKPKDKSAQRDALLNFIINYMMFSLIAMASDLTILRSNRVMMRLATMPLRIHEVLGGHVLAFAAMLVGQVFIVHLTVKLVLGIELVSNLFLGLLIMGAMVLIILSLGLLVTRFTSQTTFVPLVANGLMVPLMMVSGTFMNLEGLGWLSQLKYITPQFWVTDAYAMLNTGAGNISLHLMILLVMGFVIFTLSTIGRDFNSLQRV